MKIHVKLVLGSVGLKRVSPRARQDRREGRSSTWSRSESPGREEQRGPGVGMSFCERGVNP